MMRAHAALLGALLTTLIALPAHAAENLLVNPGFEEIDEATGFAAAWEPTFWSNPKGTIEASEVAHSGERSVMLRGLPPEQITDAGRANNHLVAQELGERVTGMRRLVLRAWVRTEGDGAARLSTFTYDAEGNRLQYGTSRTWSGLDDWTEVAMTITTDPATARLLIYLRNAGEGAVWYDDVSLTSSEDVLDSGVAQIIVDSLVGGRVRSFNPVGGAERTVWPRSSRPAPTRACCATPPTRRPCSSPTAACCCATRSPPPSWPGWWSRRPTRWPRARPRSRWRSRSPTPVTSRASGPCAPSSASPRPAAPSRGRPLRACASTATRNM